MASSLIGQRIGDYEVVARVGTGGMGAVFEAKHPVIGKRVAVKVLHPAFARDPTTLERFVNEARVVNAIGHPAIVDIFSFGKTDEGMPYFVMEFLRGRSVFDVLAQDGVFSIGRAIDLTCQLFEVLDRAHAAGVIHRDLKPQNLFVEEGPAGARLRVLDFGIAKSMTPELGQQLTGSAILGTPGYMAPEQINSEPLTPRADLYSAGAVLFEMVTGRAVHAGSNVGQLLLKALHEEAPRASSVRPDLPPALDAYIARLLSRDPSRRPESASAALSELRRMQSMFEEEGSAATRATLPLVGERPAPAPARPKSFISGVDDKETGEHKVHRPRPELLDLELRTEPAREAIPRDGVRKSNPSRPAVEAPAPLPVAAPQSRKSIPPIRLDAAPPAPEPIAATSIDRQMVARMKDVSEPPKKAGALKWVLLVLLLVAAAIAGWYLFVHGADPGPRVGQPWLRPGVSLA